MQGSCVWSICIKSGQQYYYMAPSVSWQKDIQTLFWIPNIIYKLKENHLNPIDEGSLLFLFFILW